VAALAAMSTEQRDVALGEQAGRGQGAGRQKAGVWVGDGTLGAGESCATRGYAEPSPSNYDKEHTDPSPSWACFPQLSGGHTGCTCAD